MAIFSGLLISPKILLHTYQLHAKECHLVNKQGTKPGYQD